MRNVRRFLLSVFAVSLLLAPTGASASDDPEIRLIEAILGVQLPKDLREFTHLSNGYRCNPWRFLRTPLQVIQEHQDALLSGDLNRAMCDYAPLARVLHANGVDIGRDAIQQSFMNIVDMFGGAMPTTTAIHHTGDVVMVNWEVYTPFASIPDGVDTFVIRFGQIQYQTMHARVEFHTP